MRVGNKLLSRRTVRYENLELGGSPSRGLSWSTSSSTTKMDTWSHAWRWLDDHVLEVALCQLERTGRPHCATSDMEKTGMEMVVLGSVSLVAILSMVSKTSTVVSSWFEVNINPSVQFLTL